MKIESLKEIKRILQESDKEGWLWKGKGLSGFSGSKLIGVLQRIAKLQDDEGQGSYLEVGVFQGLTLLSVAGVISNAKAFGIDDFSQFDPEGTNKGIIQQRAALNNIDNISLINLDYEDALENLSKYIGDAKIGLYFVDGPHDYRSQLVCLNLIKPYLSSSAVIVVDDCNYRHVRLANRDFLMANPEFKLLFEAYTECHPANMDRSDEEEVRMGWWNGVNILVCDQDNLLNPMFPQTVRDRDMYLNEHIVQSEKYGLFAPEAVSFMQSIFSFRLIKALKYFVGIWMKMRKADKRFIGKYTSMNTYSDSLNKENYNQFL